MRTLTLRFEDERFEKLAKAKEKQKRILARMNFEELKEGENKARISWEAFIYSQIVGK